MGAGQRNDPYVGSLFCVEIQGLIVGGFSEVTGLQGELEVEDYQEGGINDYVRKLPKATKYPNLVLKRGVTDSDTLWAWHQEVVQGKIHRKTINLIILDAGKNKKTDWRFINAYPVKWTGPDFKADADQIAIESLELVHEGIRRET